MQTSAPRVLARDSAEAQAIEAAIRQPPISRIDGATTCHLLRLYGFGPIPNATIASGRIALQGMLDDEDAVRIFGKAVIFSTRYGIRFSLSTDGPGVAGEAHRDQCLAAFAEAGAPLSQKVRIGGRLFTVRDLLSDSVATFDPKEQELSWTAIAYSLYLPADRPWRNRDARAFTFDQLAGELMARPLDSGSCGGTHILYSLTLLLRAEANGPLLSPAVRERVCDEMRHYVEAAVKSQAADGSWGPGWDRAANPHAVTSTLPTFRFLLTGHLLEWMERLPRDLQPPPQTYSGAAHWLSVQLSTGPQQRFNEHFCPWVHACCAIQNLLPQDTKTSTNRDSSDELSALSRGGA